LLGRPAGPEDHAMKALSGLPARLGFFKRKPAIAE
jgi:hypothetical protein